MQSIKQRILTAALLAMAQSFSDPAMAQKTVTHPQDFLPYTGKKKVKPNNKRGSNWKTRETASKPSKSHKERNKKGKP